MKNYVVMTNYGAYEGWKIGFESDKLPEAFEKLKEFLNSGIGETVIFRPLELSVVDIVDWQPAAVDASQGEK